MIPRHRAGIRAITTPLLLISVSSLVLVSQTTWRGVSHDLSSFLAPIVAITRGNSGLYDTYFNVAPPGIHLTLLPWVWIFGPSIWSMYLLHSLFVYTHQTSLFFGLRRWLSVAESSAVLLITTAVGALNNVFSEMLLNTELVGNTLILIGFWLLPLKIPDPTPKRWVAGLSLLLMAVMVREVYLFAPILALTIFALKFHDKPFRRAFLPVISWASLLCAAPLLAMLLAVEGLRPYFQVLHLKRALFPWPDSSAILLAPVRMSQTVFDLWPSLALPAAILASILGVSTRRGKPTSLLLIVVAVASLGVTFEWQGKPASGHYLASLLPLFAGLLAFSLIQVRLISPNFLKPFALLLLIPPSIADFTTDLKGLKTPMEWWSSTLGAEAPVAPSGGLSDLTGCAQVAYGWNAGTFYLDSGMNPCSRYFLVNLVKDSPAHRAQYILDLLAAQPSVVVYEQQGADLDINEFERIGVPWESIVSTCYKKIGANRYVPRLDDSETRRCVQRFLFDPFYFNMTRAKISLSEVLGEGA